MVYAVTLYMFSKLVDFSRKDKPKLASKYKRRSSNSLPMTPHELHQIQITLDELVAESVLGKYTILLKQYCMKKKYNEFNQETKKNGNMADMVKCLAEYYAQRCDAEEKVSGGRIGY